MAAYALGSSGDQVKAIQQRLQEQGLYRGPLDGIFGGGTHASLRALQRANGLQPDGIVGKLTWAKLFGTPFAPPPILSQPIGTRCLALTGSFETNVGPPDCFAGLSGDFDGQGLSFGVCQWNFGQGSLQPLLNEMLRKHDDAAQAVFQDHYDVLVAALSSTNDDLMTFVRSIQDPVTHSINEPWRGMFKSLGRTPEFQAIEVAAAGALMDQARALCAEYGLTSQRALALMFDIKVQNGSISPTVKVRIEADLAVLPTALACDALEVAKMRAIADRRAGASNPRWVDDVRTRKLCIANGNGKVHGIPYDLAEQYGISLADA